MLKDLVRAKFIAGQGGSGLMSFGPMKRPDGGDGGKGGDVYLEGSTNVYDLSFIKQDQKFVAENGCKGEKNNKMGKNGKDLIIKVPLITRVYDRNTNRLLLTINEHGEKKLLSKGGLGGYGNYYFKSLQFEGNKKATPGSFGREIETKLELILKSDVIFIGLPNAGKSSLLNEMTSAHAKVASYAFTTLDPHLGRADDGITLMDLPGLIEGTAEGKGLGTKFLRHALASKLVAHFISLESDDPVRDYLLIRKEVKEISEELYNMPEVIVLTKSDLVKPEVIDVQKKALKKFNNKIVVTSAYDLDALNNMMQEFKKSLSMA